MFLESHTAEVMWTGSVSDRAASLAAATRSSVDVTFAGLPGDDHAGITRPACSRTLELYAVGTEIKNTRQLSVVSAEELAVIAGKIGMDELSPELLGANLMIRGIPSLTLVPPSSRLQFASGATLVVDMRNMPCNLPAPDINAVKPGAGRKFKAAAADLRGVTAWVQREGRIAIGDHLKLFLPAQPAWPGRAR